MLKKLRIAAAALILLLCMTACSAATPSETPSASALPDITHEELAAKTWSAKITLLDQPYKVSITFPEKGKGVAHVNDMDYEFKYSIKGRELTASTTEGNYNVTGKMSDDGTQITVNYIATITLTAE